MSSQTVTFRSSTTDRAAGGARAAALRAVQNQKRGGLHLSTHSIIDRSVIAHAAETTSQPPPSSTRSEQLVSCPRYCREFCTPSCCVGVHELCPVSGSCCPLLSLTHLWTWLQACHAATGDTRGSATPDKRAYSSSSGGSPTCRGNRASWCGPAFKAVHQQSLCVQFLSCTALSQQNCCRRTL